MNIKNYAWALILNNLHIFWAHANALAIFWNQVPSFQNPLWASAGLIFVLHSSQCHWDKQGTDVSCSYGVAGFLGDKWLLVVLVFVVVRLFLFHFFVRGVIRWRGESGKSRGEPFTGDCSGEPSFLTAFTENKAKAIPRSCYLFTLIILYQSLVWLKSWRCFCISKITTSVSGYVWTRNASR